MIIITVLDESGSMSSIRDATISGFNEFLEDRKQDINTRNIELKLFTSVIFNTTVRKYEYTSIEDVSPLDHTTYEPSGMTALYDAIGQGIQCIPSDFDDDLWFIIITDGLDNRSQRYSRTDIQKEISKYSEKSNCHFIFCGANQDAYLSSKEIGIDNTIPFETNKESIGSLYRGLSRHVSGDTIEPHNNLSQPSPKLSSQRPRLVRMTSDGII